VVSLLVTGLSRESTCDSARFCTYFNQEAVQSRCVLGFDELGDLARRGFVVA